MVSIDTLAPQRLRSLVPVTFILELSYYPCTSVSDSVSDFTVLKSISPHPTKNKLHTVFIEKNFCFSISMYKGWCFWYFQDTSPTQFVSCVVLIAYPIPKISIYCTPHCYFISLLRSTNQST